MAKLNDLVDGRDNNFNLLRMIAASAVLISHAYPIALGTGANEPLSSILQMTLGTLAVLTFFTISGFFISQSFDRKHSGIGFWIARILRVYPGLLVVLLLTVLFVGPTFTSLRLGAYFSDPSTLLYIPHNLTLKWLQYGLPGVFHDNPYPTAINGSLWTLFYEAVCYGMVAVVGALRLTGQSWGFVLFLCLYAVANLSLKLIGPLHNYLLEYSPVANIQLLMLPFVLGMVLYQFRRLLQLNLIMCLGLGSAALLAHGGSWFPEFFVLFWCYLTFYLGYLPFKPLKAYNRIGDYSYGMYIYAFPCEQIGASLWKGISPLGLMAVSFPAALALAVVSWHLIERRALGYRAVVARWLERNITKAVDEGPTQHAS